MKKIFILLIIFLTSCTVYAQYTYSPSYIQHLKNCSLYTDEYTTTIPTNDETSPYLNIKSSEQIVGWLNNKCITKSTIYSLDLEQNIMAIKCSLSKTQLESLINKLKNVNLKNDKESKVILSDEMIKFIEDKNTCNVKNYLTE